MKWSRADVYRFTFVHCFFSSSLELLLIFESIKCFVNGRVIDHSC